MESIGDRDAEEFVSEYASMRKCEGESEEEGESETDRKTGSETERD